jgi:hypothetical protein
MAINATLIKLCPAHFKMLADEHHIISGIALVLQAALNDDRFLRTCGWDPETGAQADAEKIDQAITQHNPLCCFIGQEKMEEIVLQVAQPKNTHPL